MARTQAVTILFCDLVKSTERRARLGDDDFDEFTKRFMGTLRAAIAAHGGREVSSAGDGLMVAFPESVADSLACADAMHRGVAGLDADDPPMLRIGISCGEVAQDGADYSGMPIVEAARLEAAATPGTTFANAVVRSLVGSRRSFRFRDVGALTLKGIPEPLAVVEIVGDDAVEIESATPRSPPTTPSPVPAPARTPGAGTGRRRGRIAAAAIAAVIALVAIGLVVTSGGSGGNDAVTKGVPKPVGYAPKLEPTTCPAAVLAAASEATCAHLVVPQDRSKPSGKQVTLLVTRAPPRTPGPKTEPSIDLCGCESVGTSLTRDHAELIQLSARGFEGSEPMLLCPEMSAERTAALVQRANDPAEVARGTAALSQCHDRLVRDGIDPSQYNYRVAAQDALDLMVALRIPRADFTASDLVSAEVFEILRRAPGAVRSITIDNPAAPGLTGLTDPVADLAGAFKRYVAQCDEDTACARSYPNLADTWRTAYMQYEANPRLVQAVDPDASGSKPVPVLVDGPRAADALATALADPTTYGLIPAAITSPTGAAVVVDEVFRSDASFHPDTPWGTLASYLCAYDVHTEASSAIALEASTLPQFTRGALSHWTEWCSGWKVPSVYDALSADVVGPVPALLFRGDLSAFGNAQWMRQIDRGLSRDQNVTFPTLGSGLLAYGPACLSSLRRDFLKHPTATLPTAACAKQSPPIDFATG